jgi:ATP-dependent DNA helicase RecG
VTRRQVADAGVGAGAGRRGRPAAVAASRAELGDPIGALPGAGPRTAERLAARGLATVGDLLYHLPRAYDDLRRVTPIGALAGAAPGTVVLVRGTVERVRSFPHRFLDVVVGDGVASVRARWFRPPRGMARGFVKGAAVALAGPVRFADDGAAELVHPSNLTAALAAGDDDGAAGALRIRPRYSAIPGVAGRVLEAIAAAAVDRCAERAPEVLTPEQRRRLELPSLCESLRALHRPAPTLADDELAALRAGRSAAHRRLAFEDLLVLQLGLGARRRQARAQAARPCAADAARALAAARAAFPFALTAAQVRAAGEIARDMAAPRPMQRLLIGDVGSGKTAVAFMAAALAAASGGQALLMAPTEVLAEQHGGTLAAMAARLSAAAPDAPPARPLRVARLTAGTSRAERDAVIDGCRAGAIDLLVGTQALFDPRLGFRDLRLAIIDEQHRFGVAQRARFRRAAAADGGLSVAGLPHLLVMSATPIPRTLALTLYGDLDVSLLDELPPGRRAPATVVARGEDQRRAAYAELRARVAEGRQAFVVCPVRDDAARAGAVTAAARFAELRRELAPAGISVGLIHGGLDAARKEAALTAFASGATGVLVATTVVELGIDVPNAAVMLVEEADRFGLAQLHQLRGRVGRGAHAGICFLCTAGDEEPTGAGDEAARRLAELAATGDGFRIAEADLAMRGHGDLFGVRQAGIPRFRFSDLSGYLALLETARAEAERIAARDPELSHEEHRALRAAVDERWAEDAVFGEEAG